MPTSSPSALADLTGVFADGWTEDDISSVLADVSERLGRQLVCVWEYTDLYGCGGHSDLAQIGPDGTLLQIPAGLWELLVDGDEHASIDLAAAAGEHPDYAGVRPCAGALADGGYLELDSVPHNLVLEDRCA